MEEKNTNIFEIVDHKLSIINTQKLKASSCPHCTIKFGSNEKINRIRDQVFVTEDQLAPLTHSMVISLVLKCILKI